MSAVDVIDAAINKVRQHAWPQAMDLEEARAAVAELIEADREYDHAKARRIEADNRTTRGDRTDEAFRLQASANHAYDRANARRAAALANIGAAP